MTTKKASSIKPENIHNGYVPGAFSRLHFNDISEVRTHILTLLIGGPHTPEELICSNPYGQPAAKEAIAGLIAEEMVVLGDDSLLRLKEAPRDDPKDWHTATGFVRKQGTVVAFTGPVTVQTVGTNDEVFARLEDSLAAIVRGDCDPQCELIEVRFLADVLRTRANEAGVQHQH